MYVCMYECDQTLGRNLDFSELVAHDFKMTNGDPNPSSLLKQLFLLEEFPCN